MSTTSNDFADIDLPGLLGIFPLPSAVLLPRQRLPLNIFEPRYLAMVDDALRSNRHIAMIQPMSSAGEVQPSPVYPVGCAGRITTFQELEDGRLLIQLTGVCRFRIAEEVASEKGYRRVRPDWRPYRADLADITEQFVNLGNLEECLRVYVARNGLTVDWDSLRRLPAAYLVDFLAVNLPLDVEEKQALIELPDVSDRASALRSALEMANTVTAPPGRELH